MSVIFLNLLGYSLLVPQQSMGTMQPAFEVNIEGPQKVSANEEFTVAANLKVNIKGKLTITSREQLFIYLIKDSSGKLTNSYAVKDVGLSRSLSAGEIITEEYKHKIKEPGVYEISATAEFTLDKDGESKNYKIVTESKKVEVTETAE
ncbi:hypothetical protein J7E73_18305 [Paenibacillus albidus]|uniref:hypothetical protein n=1 Tax=Paenibacillus albidus TaxID=2041023 RepID=UPI001BE8A394|nr:hypothetical protein [Paenibacillus albidus]MBT2291055.1 hypothetical protein [Paenibacillus albidus]